MACAFAALRNGQPFPGRFRFVVTMEPTFEHWTSWTPKKMNALLGELRKGKSVSAACRKASVPRSTYYHWLEQDADFKRLMDDAIEEGTDALEDTALDRATADENPSDTLIIFLLKGRRPGKFRENSTVRHEGENGGPFRIELVGIDAEDI